MQLRTVVAARPARGQTVSGDHAYVRPFEGGFVLAVIDALGHGPEAHLVAQKADAVLAGASTTASVTALFDAVHRELRGTRGAAMTLVRSTGNDVEAAGVGNVGLRCAGLSLGFTSSAGILGAHHRSVRVARAAVTAPARLVLFSDGVSRRFALDSPLSPAPGPFGEALLAQHSVEHDDATVLVADLSSV